MILPNYEVKVKKDCKSQILLNILFDKVIVILFGDAKYKRVDISFVIKKGVRRRNVDLFKYLYLVNDYLVSNSYFALYKDNAVDLLNHDFVKSISFEGVKISSCEIEYINEHYPNLRDVSTKRCTIYKQANFGVLSCDICRDFNSDIISLDSYNGFSGRSLIFQNSNIINNNSYVLHLNSVLLKMLDVDIDFETFILMLDAPNLRKLELYFKNGCLSDNDLLFISGLYNLESISVDAVVSSYDQIKKLEKLREVKGILLNDKNEMLKTLKKRRKYYDKMKESNASDDSLNKYLMFQSMLIYNKYLDLLNKLYVKRLDRVEWEEKIKNNDIDFIKNELIRISNMSCKDRKNIAREIKKYNLADSLDDLWFDKVDDDIEDVHMVNSRPFQDGGIDYYVKSKKIIIDKY